MAARERLAMPSRGFEAFRITNIRGNANGPNVPIAQGYCHLDRLYYPRSMDLRPGELVAVRAGSHWPELVGPIQMIHAQGHPIWLAVLDVDTGDVLGVPTSHVIGKLENFDPAPKEWTEPEGPMESFGFEDWPGVGVVYAD